MRAAPMLALAIMVLAGCTAPTPEPVPPKAAAAALPDMDGIPQPEVDAAGARQWWEGFVRATPYRMSQSPTNVQAANMIESELKAIGFEARTIYYAAAPFGVASCAEASGQGIRTVVGIKEGTEEPDHVIGWVAHYDSVATTIYAAYDDGSGVAVAMELARTLAAVPTKKTLMAIFFDAEELGLVASNCFVQQAMRDASVQFDLVIGHDMTGINCPGHEWKMYQFTGENFAAELVPIEEALFADERFFTPEERACIEVIDVADRNSDERRFKEAGVPVLRMAGGRKAADYPEYHKPGDTVEFVYEFAGSPENYEAGLGLTVVASYWNVHVFDRLPRLEG
ncbi:MAG TPA: M28 family peptidase [Candidatus Thermoplasmatota archaeon]|nr:M28 family peptidase [Candidatus Thermoplasmatota archaeon]